MVFKQWQVFQVYVKYSKCFYNVLGEFHACSFVLRQMMRALDCSDIIPVGRVSKGTIVVIL